jgi:hypothetical protein
MSWLFARVKSVRKILPIIRRVANFCCAAARFGGKNRRILLPGAGTGDIGKAVGRLGHGVVMKRPNGGATGKKRGG